MLAVTHADFHTVCSSPVTRSIPVTALTTRMSSRTSLQIYRLLQRCAQYLTLCLLYSQSRLNLPVLQLAAQHCTPSKVISCTLLHNLYLLDSWHMQNPALLTMPLSIESGLQSWSLLQPVKTAPKITLAYHFHLVLECRLLALCMSGISAQRCLSCMPLALHSHVTCGQHAFISFC